MAREQNTYRAYRRNEARKSKTEFEPKYFIQVIIKKIAPCRPSKIYREKESAHYRAWIMNQE